MLVARRHWRLLPGNWRFIIQSRRKGRNLPVLKNWCWSARTGGITARQYSRECGSDYALGGFVFEFDRACLAPGDELCGLPASDGLAIDDDFFHVIARGNLEHHIQQHLFDDSPQTARASLLL